MARVVVSGAWQSWVTARARWLRTEIVGAALRAGCTLSEDTGRVVATPRVSAEYAAIANAALECCDNAERCAARFRPIRWLTGSAVENAWANIHAAQVRLVDLVDDDVLRAQVAEIVEFALTYLPKTDLRRAALEDRWRGGLSQPGGALAPTDRGTLTAAMRGAQFHVTAEMTRVRSFRNVLLGGSAVLAGLAVGLGVLAQRYPTMLPLCFHDTAASAAGAVCPSGRPVPTPGDVVLVETVGLVGAALAGVRALSGAGRSTTPYSLLVAQALLKAAAGAVTAVFGLVMLRAGVVPGFAQLDSQPQILAYALVFGYAQQLFTRVVDQRADQLNADAPPGQPPDPVVSPAALGPPGPAAVHR